MIVIVMGVNCLIVKWSSLHRINYSLIVFWIEFRCTLKTSKAIETREALHKLKNSYNKNKNKLLINSEF